SMLDEQIPPSRLGIAGPDEKLPGLKSHERGGVGQRHSAIRPRPKIGREDSSIHRPALDFKAHFFPVGGHRLSHIRPVAPSTPHPAGRPALAGRGGSSSLRSHGNTPPRPTAP